MKVILYKYINNRRTNQRIVNDVSLQDFFKNSQNNFVYIINYFIFAPNSIIITMEQNKEMTASESLALIAETMNNSRRVVLRNNAFHFMLWGALLTAFSLIIYFLWHTTGNAGWNLLWFAMPVIGYGLAALLDKKKDADPKNEISRLLGLSWAAFGFFSVVLSAIAIFLVPMNITLIIVLLLGLAECISGVILKNWPIAVAGIIMGIGGAVAAVLLKSEAQLLLFTLGGVLLAVTGLIIKLQYK